MNTVSGQLYYPVRYRLEHKDRWLIWHTHSGADREEADGVVVDPNGRVTIFRSEQTLIAFAHTNQMTLTDADTSVLYNLDVVRRWFKRKRPAKPDCIEFLNAWNLFADISATVGGNFDADKNRSRKIYSKLFWGNNLPSITPADKHYVPLWPGRESRLMREILRAGLLLLRDNIVEA